ncbi:MAG: DUF3305 domain-containing protein [Alphaproteobacteria bacterium]|nr:DUF3305 domain-containing protein [Alphaproteobacteria bacterium]
MQTSEAIAVGIVAERRALASPWADHDWRPLAVLAAAPDLEPGSLVAEEPGRRQYYLGALELRLHRKETDSYRHNLASGEPRLYVALRHGEGPGGLPVLAFQVSAAPDEGQAWAEVGDDVVDGLPMPPAVAEWVADFVARFHVEQPRYKRQREPAVIDRPAPPGAAPRGWPRSREPGGAG